MTGAGLAALGAALALVAGAGPAARRLGSQARRGRGSLRSRRVGAGRELAAVLHTVAAQLRAGAEPGAAWALALDGERALGAEELADLLAATTATRRRGAPRRPRGARPLGGRPTADGGRAGRVHAAVAAVRVAEELGAPLAPALERIAETVALDEEDEADLRAALAGPRATARLLAWLPLLGLALAGVLGAHPVAVVLGGGLGSALGAAGVVLAALGRWWSARLVRGAARGAGP